MTRGDEAVQQAVFASDTVDLGSGWSVLAGWRYNDYETRGRYHTYPVTPTYAVMLKPREAVTLYASYIESLEAGSRVGNSYVNAGDVLDPTISKQYEIGAKVEGHAGMRTWRRSGWSVAPTSMSSRLPASAWCRTASRCTKASKPVPTCTSTMP